MPIQAVGCAMSNNDPYFQFPLSALAWGKTPEARKSAIMDFCIVEMGRNRGAAMTTAEMKAEVATWPAENHPAGLRLTDRGHLALCVGMKVLKVAHGNVQTITLNAVTLSHAIAGMAAKHGASPFVRIRHDLFWDAFKEKMEYRRFAVLCAVYAVIGAKEYPVRITRDRIRAGALGYKTAAMMTPEVIALRTDGAQPLTDMQIRRTLDELENASLITRVQVSKRKVVFSNRMDRKEMTAAVLATATKRATKLRNHRDDDQKLQAAIKVVNHPKPTPRINHAVTTGQPLSNHSVTTEQTTLIKAPLIEAHVIETILKETENIPVPPSGERAVLVQESMPTERDRLQRLIEQATQIGTPEALMQAEAYRLQLREENTP
jgi:hypothetical protein